MPAVNTPFYKRDGFGFCEEAPPADECTIHAALVMSRGGIPWYGVDVLSAAKRERLKETFAFIKQREDRIGEVLVTDVALHLSGDARDLSGLDKAQQYFAGVLGFFQAATELHYPVDFLLDDQLDADHLSKYRVLILSNAAALSEDQVEDIGAFVRGGGTLLATHLASLLDRNGHVRDTFALADIMGVDVEQVLRDAKGSGIIRIAGRDPIRGSFSILNDASRVRVRMRQGAPIELLATYSRCGSAPAAGEAHPPAEASLEIAEESAAWPVIVMHSYGTGRAYYCGFDLGRAYLDMPLQGTRELIGSMLEGGSAPRVHLTAPKCIEFSAMESSDGRRLYLHVINAPATSVKAPGWHRLTSVVDEVLPVYGIVAEIRDRTVTRAINALSGKSVEVRRDGVCARIQFDCTNVHEIIIVD
jgi:hypothetical protein